MSRVVHNLYDAKIETFNKKGYWELFLIRNFIDTENDGEDKIIRVYNKEKNKIVTCRFPYGKIISFNMKLSTLIIKDGKNYLSNPEDNIHLLRKNINKSRFGRYVPPSIDYSKYKKEGGSYCQILTEYCHLTKFQIKNHKSKQSFARKCTLVAKEIVMKFLKKNS